MCFSSDIAGPSHPSLADGRVVSLYGKQLHICAFVPCVFYVWSCTCTAARLHRPAAARTAASCCLGSGIWEPGLEAQGNIRLPVRHLPSSFAIRHSGCKTSKVARQDRLAQRAWPLQATSPLSLEPPEPPSPSPPPRPAAGKELLCCGVWAALLIAVVGCIALWVPGTASEGAGPPLVGLAVCLPASPPTSSRTSAPLRPAPPRYRILAVP